MERVCKCDETKLAPRAWLCAKRFNQSKQMLLLRPPIKYYPANADVRPFVKR